MLKPTKTASRAAAFVLAVLMSLQSAFPLTAYAAPAGMAKSTTIIDPPVSGETGSGWDGIDLPESSASEEPQEPEEPSAPPEQPDLPAEDEGNTPSLLPELPEKENSSSSIPAINGTPLSWAENFNAYAKACMAGSIPTILEAGDEGGGRVVFTRYYWGAPNGGGMNAVWMGSGPNGGGKYFAEMHRITYDGADAFCGEFNKQAPGGNYVRGEEGNDEEIKKILASYEQSNQSKGDYIAAQAFIWAKLLGTTVNYWGTSGANEDLLDPDVDTSGIHYWIYENVDTVHTQNLIVYTNDKGFTDKYALKIIKKSEDGSQVVSNATFSVTGPGGFNKTGLKTNTKGEILVYLEKPGEYTVTETAPPPGYELAKPNSQKVQVTEENKNTNPAVVEFRNKKLPDGGGDGQAGIVTDQKTETEVHQSKEYEYSDAIGQVTIRKEDQSGRSLDGALFKITVEFADGSSLVEENWEVDNGARLFTWTHPPDDHSPAKVTIQETKAPEHYELDPEPKTVTVSPTFTRVTHVTTWTVTITTTTTSVTTVDEDGVPHTSTSTATATTESQPQVEEYTDFIAGDREITTTFVNQRITGDIIVTKRDANTGQPLEGAHVHLWGEDLGDPNHIDMTLVTDKNGEARFEFLPPGTYAIQETQPPFGYNLNDEIQNAVLQSGQIIHKEIRNYRKDGLFIKKVDQDGKPLPGATFELRRGSGEVLLREVTNENGIIYRGNLTDDTYVIEEIAAPEGYLMDKNPTQTIRIYATDDNKEYTVTFVNKKKPAIELTKVDGDDTSVKLAGAVFRITDTTTGKYWDVETGEDGKALLEGLEINRTYIVEEIKAPAGYEKSGYRKEIVLQEARTHTIIVENFKNPSLIIEKRDAETLKPLVGAQFRIEKASGELIGTYTTDIDGLIEIDPLNGLAEGAVVITEVKAPDGYVLDSTPHRVNLTLGQATTVELYNTSKPGLQIIKKDSLTGQPVGGARFSVVQLLNSGGEKKLGEFTTSQNGTFFIPDLTPGRYVITELQAADGYILDSTPRTVEIEGGKLNVVEVYNTPYSDLRLVKIDAETRQVLEGAVFKLFDKDRLEIGTYTTNAQGEIFIRGLESGTVYLQEQKAPPGYVLDNTVRRVELLGGKTTTVEWKNAPMGTLRILKIDAETKKPLYGASFLLYDFKNNLLGEYTTDQNGLIVFGSSLQTGTYRIKEIKAPDGYVLDEKIHTIKVKSGETTEIVIENKLQTGNIQILKVSSGYNKETGEKAGAPLSGAVFEIYDENLKLVDKIRTDSRGIATSDDLPLGRYVLKEVQAPRYYYTDGKPIYVELKTAGDLVRLKVQNTPANLEVHVEKNGVAETMPGETFRYTFPDISNRSGCPLTNFYWRDTLPTDAVRILSLHTGTWKHGSSYDVWIKTNQNGWRKIESSLSPDKAYDISLTAAALDLAANEYITDFKLEFGTVEPGFSSINPPSIQVVTASGLTPGYRIVNKTDAGGRFHGKWVYGRDSWVTTIYAANRKLPQTGGK